MVQNTWLNHVSDFMRANPGIPRKQALQLASKTYVKPTKPAKPAKPTTKPRQVTQKPRKAAPTPKPPKTIKINKTTIIDMTNPAKPVVKSTKSTNTKKHQKSDNSVSVEALNRQLLDQGVELLTQEQFEAILRHFWAPAKTYQDMVDLNVKFLQGKIVATPYHWGPTMGNLVEINRAGFITTEGQPHIMEEGLFSYVQGFLPKTRAREFIEFMSKRKEVALFVAEMDPFKVLFSNSQGSSMYFYEVKKSARLSKSYIKTQRVQTRNGSSSTVTYAYEIDSYPGIVCRGHLIWSAGAETVPAFWETA